MTGRHRLLGFVQAYFGDDPSAVQLLTEFLDHPSYSRSFFLKLLAVAKAQTETPWNIRRLAVLMLEHQILKIHPDDFADFDFVLGQLDLKVVTRSDVKAPRSVLKEGYSTTELRPFINEFRRRLERQNYVHAKIKGFKTSEAALGDFLDLARRDCRLSLARYLFTVEEVVDEILSQLRITDGARDLDTTQPLFVEAEAERALKGLPDFEAGIVNKLCRPARIYWVSDQTSSEINSLVEYPLTTVVLAIKPPGSEFEFEIKRAGRRGPLGLNVIYVRDGYEVSPSHRLDGGAMQWLLRHEARAAAKFGLIYRLVHKTAAPIPDYIARSNVYAVPVNGTQVQTLTYFTEPRVFEKGFFEMRHAMFGCVAAFKNEGYNTLPDLPGDLGLTAQFVGLVTPAQAILSGTSSFRLDKIAAYLSSDGPRLYFQEGLNIGNSKDESKRFADEMLDEVLGVYQPPDVSYRSHEQYLSAAFAAPANRARADETFLSLLDEIGKTWGTLMGLRGYTRGESFVARNVGLKSAWVGGEWKVKIIFMDHDSVVIPNAHDQDFNGHETLTGMTLDETYMWGKPGRMLGAIGHLRRIYRVSDELYQQGLESARAAMKQAYKKTQRALLRDEKLRALFHPIFLDRLAHWDKLVKGYLRNKPKATEAKWKDSQRKILVETGYQGSQVDEHMEAIENNRAFLERYAFLF
ncbi:MAG TPA: hypothetical protein VGO68_10280 [Pyrinomonadaceae bacterium]|jgi:hypothetical protein|nr:hypothetical protein [Pyrinomonadaceae bacterium]